MAVIGRIWPRSPSRLSGSLSPDDRFRRSLSAPTPPVSIDVIGEVVRAGVV